MISKPNEHVIILGGGVAGLATGLELIRRGRRVTVIEKGERVGGLARTLVYGDFRFDIGGHRFHSHKPEIIAWIKELMGADLLRVPRISHIYLQNKFVDYPLRFPNALSIFSPPQAARILASYGAAALRRRLNGRKKDVSFEDWVVHRFGRAMFDVFFGPYTEKVWGISCQELSADWAAQRISLPSLTEAVKRAIAPGAEPPSTIISHFWYPRAGFGMIPDRMSEEIERLGGRVLTSASVAALEPRSDGGWRVHVQERDGVQRLTGDRVISSIPLHYLLAALPPESGAADIARRFSLSYRDMVLLFLALKIPRVSEDSWTYFPQTELLCGRTHEPRNWSAEMAPEGRTSLAAEVFTSRGEATWEMSDEQLVARAVREFEEIGFLPPHSLMDAWVLRVPYAYPVYYIGYAEKVRRVREFLDAAFPDLHLVGRTGSFRYMNSDGVIEDALALTDYLTGTRHEYVDVSKDYKVD
ncbi:MAG: FAD-dependent oxidoreductase [Chloroflexi bacterium]|nr:FAD-dependent oxidoreductase [Chloroflexota bacterium]